MKSKKEVYPIILELGEDFILVEVPDFGISTQGMDMSEAIEMARDAIGLVGIDLLDEGKAIPPPSAFEIIQTMENQIKTLVDIDFTEYRRKNDQRVVKKNCTIPSWIAYEAEKANINFSATLQEALKLELEKRKVI
ncbi:MAG: type II toxin-antitoxin system HicB family antitoxin [Peptostreptococcaceae bacterium]|nr:type II toxin-antitoxin system HicB family antitoxin [Peptostreptococcaceae bacterium]